MVALLHDDVEVYPRVCGGTAFEGLDMAHILSLSPRVRGNQKYLLVVEADAGSIPACAGEPAGHRSRMLRKWVYPRVCGGTIIAVYLGTTARGLSPRVRGNQIERRNRRSIIRSIPACAGEPQVAPRRCDGVRVYPRVCGGTEWGNHRRHAPLQNVLAKPLGVIPFVSQHILTFITVYQPLGLRDVVLLSSSQDEAQGVAPDYPRSHGPWC